ncbi:hypothetical protein KDL45_18370, partial [bacterium]|nr:hypothetical protein [bacterium]
TSVIVIPISSSVFPVRTVAPEHGAGTAVRPAQLDRSSSKRGAPRTVPKKVRCHFAATGNRLPWGLQPEET